MTTGLTITFWGTRGSITPHLPSSEFGIHTTCVELTPGDRTSLFIDLGTGASPAANSALQRGLRTFDIFLTHLHSDHLSGILTFSPLYNPECRVRIHACRPGLEATLRRLFAPPIHPVRLDNVPASLELIELPATGSMALEEQGAKLSWAPMPHPQGSTAYRLDADDNSFAFITDVELAKTRGLGPLRQLLTTGSPVGLAAVDGFFTEEELPTFPGWGHSTWQQAQALAAETGIADLLITHHHPGRTDQALREMEASARPLLWARESRPAVLQHNRLVPS